MQHEQRDSDHGGRERHGRPGTQIHPVREGGREFTVASTPRTFDRQANEWKDGDALFLRSSAWGDLGEHVAASLTKGSRVIVQGRLRQRSYQTKEGEQRTSIELEVDEIGPSLRYATAQVVRAGGQERRQEPFGGGNAQTPESAWNGPQTGAQAYDEETPF
jgi:single-strand DNA-binding protein